MVKGVAKARAQGQLTIRVAVTTAKVFDGGEDRLLQGLARDPAGRERLAFGEDALGRRPFDQGFVIVPNPFQLAHLPPSQKSLNST